MIKGFSGPRVVIGFEYYPVLEIAFEELGRARAKKGRQKAKMKYNILYSGDYLVPSFPLSVT